MRVLKGVKCTLRPLVFEDLTTLLKWQNMKHVVETKEDKKFVLWNDHFRWFYQIQAEGYHYFVIEVESDLPIGVIYLTGKQKDGANRIGFYIGDSRYFDVGIEAEALQLILTYALQELKAHLLKAKVDKDNQKRIDFLEKMGFHIEKDSENKNGFINMNFFTSGH